MKINFLTAKISLFNDYKITMKYNPNMFTIPVINNEGDDEGDDKSDDENTTKILPKKILPGELSYNMQKQMCEAIKNDDVETYKNLFSEYIDGDNNIYTNFFSYDEQGPPCPHHFSKYPFCICVDENRIEDVMGRVHKYNSIVECGCQNGKYYLALYDAYCNYISFCGFGFSIPGMIKRIEERKDEYKEEYKKLLDIKENKVKIITFLHLLNKRGEFDLMFDWESCHIEKSRNPLVRKYEHCKFCNDDNVYVPEHELYPKTGTVVTNLKDSVSKL